MTALATYRKTQELDPGRAVPHILDFPQKANVEIFFGGMVGVDTSGRAVPASADNTLKIVGMLGQSGVVASGESQDSTGLSDGDLRARVLCGTFKYANGDSITVANLFAPAYCVDDQTVAKSSNSGARPRCGTIVGVESDGVWVMFASGLGGAAGTASSSAWTQTYSTANRTVANPTSAALTENGGALGGTNDGDLPDLTATAATLTDNSGGGAADGTIGAVTPAAAITDSSGGVDPGDNTIAAITNANNAGSADVVPTAAAIAQLAAKANTTRTAVVALTDAVKELSTMLNLVIADNVNLRAAIREVAAGHNEVVADDLDNRQSVTALIDDLQTAGIVS